MESFDIEIESDAVHFQSLLATAQADIILLKEQINRRTILLDELRTAYIRDVIVVKDRLWKHGIHTDEELQALPSVELKPLLPLFSPATSVLRVQPCLQCGGCIELIRRDDDSLVRAQFEAQTAKQELQLTIQSKKAIETTLATALEDLQIMQRVYSKEQKLNAFLQEEKKRLKGKLDVLQVRSGQQHALHESKQQLESKVVQLEELITTLEQQIQELHRNLKAQTVEHVAQVELLQTEFVAERTEWVGKVERTEAKLAKAKETAQTLQVEVKKLAVQEETMETRAQLRNLKELNAMSSKWIDEVDAHRLTKDQYGMTRAEIETKWHLVSQQLKFTSKQLKHTTAALRVMVSKRDEAAADVEAMKKMMELQTREMQSSLREIEARVTEEKRTMKMKWLWCFMQSHARSHKSQAFCRLLCDLNKRIQAKAALKFEAYDARLEEKRKQIRLLERSIREWEEKWSDEHEHARGVEHRLRDTAGALEQRTSESVSATRRAMYVECQLTRKEVEYEELERIGAQTKCKKRQVEMALEEILGRSVEFIRQSAIQHVTDRKLWLDELRLLDAKLQVAQSDIAMAQRDRKSAEELLVKCQSRLKITQDCLGDKTFECMGLQEAMADAGAEMVSLEQKLSGEHRRGAMYEEMVDNMTKVIHEQETQREILEKKFLQLQVVRPPKIDFEWMLATAAAKCLQMLWRCTRARRLRPYKRGIPLQEVDHIIATTWQACQSCVETIRLVHATQETYTLLYDLGVDVSFLGEDGERHLKLVKANAAACIVQNAWKWTSTRHLCRKATGYARMSLEQRIVSYHSRHRRLSRSLKAIERARIQQRKLIFLGVKFQNLSPAKKKPPPVSSMPRILKYRLEHPLKPNTKENNISRNNNNHHNHH